MLDSMIIKAQLRCANAKEEMMTRMSERALAKKAGDETLIVKIILMVVAVVLCILFRDTLKTVITELLTQVKTNISSIYGGGSGGN